MRLSVGSSLRYEDVTRLTRVAHQRLQTPGFRVPPAPHPGILAYGTQVGSYMDITVSQWKYVEGVEVVRMCTVLTGRLLLSGTCTVHSELTRRLVGRWWSRAPSAGRVGSLSPCGGRFARPVRHSHVDQTHGTRERPTHACAIESRLVAGLFFGDRMIFERMAGASKLVKIDVVFAVESAAAALIAAEVRLRDMTVGRVTALCINLTALWLSSSRRAQRTGSPYGYRSLRRPCCFGAVVGHFRPSGSICSEEIEEFPTLARSQLGERMQRDTALGASPSCQLSTPLAW